MSECLNCKAPIRLGCDCGTCQDPAPVYCHVCRYMYAVVYRSTYFSRVASEETAERNARRNRMGL